MMMMMIDRGGVLISVWNVILIIAIVAIWSVNSVIGCVVSVVFTIQSSTRLKYAHHVAMNDQSILFYSIRWMMNIYCIIEIELNII